MRGLVSALPKTAVVAPAPVGVSDERLATRVASDPTALAELHERYEQPLLRYTRSLLRDQHDAADAAQDAWTRALVALRDSPVRVLSVRSWLFAIARNACMDRMRDGKRCAPADIDERALGASPGPEDVLELRARAREALSDLAGLSDRQRAAVVLRDLNGVEGEEFARALDTDARRASWLLTDARRSLAEVRSGRVLSCESARSQLDSARVRTRAVRAHLAGCEDCDSYARRRVASRLHLHGIAVFLFALPARLRAVLSGGLDAAKPVGAIAAATLAAGVPAVHELHRGSGAPPARPEAAAPVPSPVTPAAPAVTLPTAPRRARGDVRARTVVLGPAPRRRAAVIQVPASRPGATGAVAAPRRPVVQSLPVAVQVPVPVTGAVQRATSTLTTIAPAAAPVVRVATAALAPVTG
jgi:RNA polymerase sigma factor (sigma-70 family)